LESGVMSRCRAAHRVDHLFADFDGGRVGLGIAPEDVAVVDCDVSLADLALRSWDRLSLP
jgi:hypothetical protein